MTKIQSSVAELPASCRSAADRMATELSAEDRFAELSADSHKKLSELERAISTEAGEAVALVAYRI